MAIIWTTLLAAGWQNHLCGLCTAVANANAKAFAKPQLVLLHRFTTPGTARRMVSSCRELRVADPAWWRRGCVLRERSAETHGSNAARLTFAAVRTRSQARRRIDQDHRRHPSQLHSFSFDLELF